MIQLARPSRVGDALARLGAGFVPERARGIRATVEWLLATGGGFERVQMRIENGSLSFPDDWHRPVLTVTVALADLDDLLDGRARATDLFMRRRLTLSGDVLLAARLPHLLGVSP